MVAVPMELALVFTATRGWHYLTAPPGWWIEEQEVALSADERPPELLSLVPPLQEARTACRPGSGPCRRRHEHAAARVPA